MRIGISSYQFSDSNGCPEGGQTFGRGFAISWQRGPLGRDAERKEPNGAFVEDVIAAAADRIEFYQKSQFACKENEEALDHLNKALAILNMRTRRRESQGVEGTLKGK